MTETQLHEKLAAAGNDETSKLIENNKRKGYMGFVKCITTLLQINSKFNEPLADLLDSSDNYTEFISGDYSESLRLECLELGGASQQADESIAEENSDQVPFLTFIQLRNVNLVNVFDFFSRFF